MIAPQRRSVAVIQPYFFPYLGYWQLMAAADVFVIYDDVQYIRSGWVNRNRIPATTGPVWLTVPVAKMPLETPIASMRVSQQYGEASARIRRQVASVFRGAPGVDTALGLLDATFRDDDELLTQPLYRSFDAVRDLLGITTPMVLSSTLGVPTGGDKQSRLIEVCRAVGGTEHLSLSGGRALYSPAEFAAEGMGLRFHDLAQLRAVPELAGQFSLLDAVATMPHEWIVEHLHASRWLDE